MRYKKIRHEIVDTLCGPQGRTYGRRPEGGPMTPCPKSVPKTVRVTLTLPADTWQDILSLAAQDRRKPITMASLLLQETVENYRDEEYETS